jgi:hypothetical protein
MRPLAPHEINVLNGLVTGKNRRAARRAKAIVFLASGASFRAIQNQLDCNAHFILTWKRRFLRNGCRDFLGRHQGKRPLVNRTIRARIFRRGLAMRSDGSLAGYRSISKDVGVSPTTVRRVLESRGQSEIHFGNGVEQWIKTFRHDIVDFAGVFIHKDFNAAVFVPRKSRPSAQWLQNPANRKLLATRQRFELPDPAKFDGVQTLGRDPDLLKVRPRIDPGRALGQFFEQVERLPQQTGDLLVVVTGESERQLELLRQVSRRRKLTVLSVVPTLAIWHQLVRSFLGMIEDDVRSLLGPAAAAGLADRVQAGIRDRQHAMRPVQWVYRRKRQAIQGSEHE